MLLNFYKYQGTGNDFVILDNRNKQYDGLNTKQVRHLCDRRFGIGADGLMLLNLLEGYDFEMKYYNADGRESSMCGNGGRCLVQFANDIGINRPSYSFLAIDGPHQANFDRNGWVQLKMKDVMSIENYHGDYVLDTGSPHYVKHVNDVMHFDVVEHGKEIRYSEHYKKEGINVNFVEQQEDNIIVRTYERGVEDETYSCGTGVTACAIVSCHNETGFNRIEVKTLGGKLAVEYDKRGNHYTDVWLCGPATFVFKGEIEID
jgi:diaminopimelate epimerase